MWWKDRPCIGIYHTERAAKASHHGRYSSHIREKQCWGNSMTHHLRDMYEAERRLHGWQADTTGQVCIETLEPLWGNARHEWDLKRTSAGGWQNHRTWYFADFVGPLPQSKYGIQMLLFPIDIFSKWTKLVPLSSATTKSPKKAFR